MSGETIRVGFHGAAGTVTGSKHLIEFGSAKILVDCGLFQGNKEMRLRNWSEPNFRPDKLSCVVLTHAHIDHTGYLPRLVRLGFNKPIYCTDATAALLQMLLPDSAHLQEEEARYALEHKTSRHPTPKPLYTQEDAQKALKLLQIMPRDAWFDLTPGVRVEARCAGHILGSCSLGFELGGKRLVFSGDIGRFDSPLLPDPAPIPLGDLLVCESTYGNKLHGTSDMKAELAEVVRRAVARQGPLIMPAFAVGRTQTVLYYLAELEREGAIPVLPVYVDSPMATDATDVYRKFQNDYDDAAAAIVKRGDRPLHTQRTVFTTKVEDSKRLNGLRGAAVIISASGMATGGRILHHLKNWLPRPESTVLFVGYQGEGTRGQIIQSGAKDVKIFGQAVPINAHVESISGLSAHGDRSELLRWLTSCPGTPALVRIVHGEPEPARSFSESLKLEKGWTSEVAKHLETVEI